MENKTGSYVLIDANASRAFLVLYDCLCGPGPADIERAKKDTGSEH